MSDNVSGETTDPGRPKKSGVMRRLIDWFRSPGVGKVEPSDDLVLERELRRGMRGDGG